MTSKALEALDVLVEKGIDPEIINIHTIKPLDDEAVIKSVQKTKRVITAEEHSVIGGLGDAVNSLLIRSGVHRKASVKNIGIEDCFGQTGSADELLEYYGLTADRIVNEVDKLIQ